MLSSLRRGIALLLPALLAAALLAGCGGDDKEPVTGLLDKAFTSPIGSADVKLDIEVALDGVDQLEEPVEIALTGPYDSTGKSELPSVDWDITVRAQNQSFNAALTSTGDRAFIGFQGTDYEADPRAVANLNRQIAVSRKREGNRDLSDFGVTARDWVIDGEEEGDEDVAGVETTHVSGKLDVARALEDLNTVVDQASRLSGVGRQAPPELTEEQREQVEEVVRDPSFDAYVGKEDNKLHRLSADLEFEVPEDARERVGGLEGGRISFTIEFANIGDAKPIAAPEDTRPIVELTQQLQGLLGGALDGATPPGQTPPSGASPPPGEAPPPGGAAEPAPQTDPEKRKAYEDCIKTDPDDESVRAFCEVLLQ